MQAIWNSEEDKMTIVFSEDELEGIIKLAAKDGKKVPEFVECLIQAGVKLHEFCSDKKG